MKISNAMHLKKDVFGFYLLGLLPKNVYQLINFGRANLIPHGLFKDAPILFEKSV